MSTITHHKKSVRAIAQHPKEYVLVHVLFFTSWNDLFCRCLLLCPLKWYALLLFLTVFCCPGMLLHLHQPTTLRNSAFQEGNFCTTCCEYLFNIFIYNIFYLNWIISLVIFIIVNNCSNLFDALSSSQQKTIINAMAINEEGVMATGGMGFLYHIASSIGIIIVIINNFYHRTW